MSNKSFTPRPKSNSNPNPGRRKRVLRNQRGQGLIEYLIIVALMGVATIAIVRTMGTAVAGRFASVTDAIQGKKSSHTISVDEDLFKKKDMGNFFDGVEAKDKKSGSN